MAKKCFAEWWNRETEFDIFPDYSKNLQYQSSMATGNTFVSNSFHQVRETVNRSQFCFDKTKDDRMSQYRIRQIYANVANDRITVIKDLFRAGFSVLFSKIYNISKYVLIFLQ